LLTDELGLRALARARGSKKYDTHGEKGSLIEILAPSPAGLTLHRPHRGDKSVCFQMGLGFLPPHL